MTAHLCYNALMDKISDSHYPLPIARALQATEQNCSSSEDGAASCLAAVLRLADALTYYLGAVAVAQYSQSVYTGQIEADPALNRSLRSLRRVLPGQWLRWTADGLAAAPNGPVEGLAAWYFHEENGEIARAYKGLRQAMVGHLAYAGDYGPREKASPRHLLELIDQYRIRRGKVPPDTLPPDFDERVAEAILPGLRAALGSTDFLTEYQLYAPQQRQLLTGLKAATPMPPMSDPPDTAATILLYPPGEAPDYTKRPNPQAERLPLFPLDPLLVYLRCPQCALYRVAALQAMVAGAPHYVGLDPDCGHEIAA